MAKITPPNGRKGCLQKVFQRESAFHAVGTQCKVNPPPPPFRGPGFPESAQNVSPNEWISDSGGKKDHLLKVFVLW